MAYGVGGEKHAEVVQDLCGSFKTKNVLDYGCGRGRLGLAMPFHIDEYDPCIPGKDTSPKPADLVTCTDMLEHVEPDRLMYVLGDLQRVTKAAGYFVVYTKKSTKTLADGRNAHLIVQPHQWWRDQLAMYFKLEWTREVGPLLYVLVTPLKQTIVQKIQPVMLPPVETAVVQDVVVA
jgi:ubiquinone/menaquinone biosynthesis C-methylase UbiE